MEPLNETISEENERSRFNSASWFSQITQSWLNAVLSKGFSRPLKQSDLSVVSPGSSPNRLPVGSCLRQRLFLFAASKGFYRNGILMLLADITSCTTPLLLSRLLKIIEMNSKGDASLKDDWWNGVGLCIGMFVLQCANTLFINLYYQRSMQLGMEIRAAVQLELFDKNMRMTCSAGRQFPTGSILNLMSGDAVRLDLATPFVHYWWSNPFQCILVACLLYELVGWSGFIGISLLIVFVPLQSIGASIMSRHRKDASSATDKRLKLLQEILHGFRTIKLKNWERALLQESEELRSNELQLLTRVQLNRATISTFSVTLPLIAFLLTMVVYHILWGQPLSQEVVMGTIAFFNLVRQPISLMPMVVATTSDAKSAIERLENFLSFEEKKEQDCIGQTTETIDDDLEVSMLECKFSWCIVDNTNVHCASQDILIEDSDQNFSVTIDSLNIEKGEMIVITGYIGSGKSSLLAAIAGEMFKISGKFYGPHSFSFSSQEPWILNRSLQDNITLGQTVNEDILHTVISMTQLNEDVGRFPKGLETIIGDRGTNLSGGQKSRVNLSRALYHCLNENTSCLLLDDPLAAIDSTVSKRIIQDCFNSHIMSKRKITRIIISQNVNLQNAADRVILLEQGKIVSVSTGHPTLPTKALDFEKPQISDEKSEKLSPPISINDEHLDQSMSTVGSVSSDVFKKYITNAGGFIYFIIPAFIWSSLQQATRTLADVTAGRWAYTTEASKSPLYVMIFLSFALAHGISFFINSLIFIYSGRRAGKRLHSGALKGILSSTLRWMGLQSSGKLLNRLSADQEIVDYALPESLRSTVVIAANVFATFLLLGIHKWYNLIPIGITICLFWFAIFYYRRSSREVCRLAAQARGPLQGAFVDAISGRQTIRAMNKRSFFSAGIIKLIDDANLPYFVQFSMQRWLELRITMLGNLVILLAALSSFLVPGPLALTSVTLTKTVTVTRVLNWLIRRMADAELQMISVERLLSLEGIPEQEPIRRNPSDAIPGVHHPPRGSKVEFKSVSVQYSGSDNFALDRLSFTIEPGEKVGIVGRTGSGKSTLALALFRAVDIGDSSLILIDGRDISTVDINVLRRSISIVPQDPFLISGSVRKNLDPEGVYADDELWQVLDKTMLRDAIRSLASGLDHLLGPSDNELSVGQLQLLSIARVLLQNPSLLIMDEATAALDPESEKVILKLTREILPECTIISIAHRIVAVTDLDRIIVLQRGSIVEDGPPNVLLAKTDSLFSTMTSDTMCN